MSLVSGSGSVAKIKAIKCELTGFTGTGTSVFGSAAAIDCPDVEYCAIGRPDKDENESEEFETNKRKIKDSVATDGWADWDKMEVFNDENGVNWRAFVAAQETDATGTITLSIGTTTIGKWLAKVSGVEGGDGDPGSLDTGFTPTFTMLGALPFAGA